MDNVHHRIDAQHILNEAHKSFAGSPHFAGRNIQVDVHNGEVVLNGVVRTYYQKQLAQESIRSISGVGDIRNNLEVI